MDIAALMIIGKKTEPFLPACLEALNECVDLLVINDNSEMVDHPNLQVIQASKLFHAGKIKLIQSAFVSFSYCRNLCFDYLRNSATKPNWVLIVDADEVHTPFFQTLTRRILPALDSSVGVVESYVYDFIQSPRLYRSLDHRHRLILRYNIKLRWEGAVHEQLTGITGKTLVLPYIFFHYGALKPPEAMMQKWALYQAMGDEASGSHLENVKKILQKDARSVFRFHTDHPHVTKEIFHQFSVAHAQSIGEFEAWSAQNPFLQGKSFVKAWFIQAKMRWVRLVAWWKCGKWISGGF